MRTSWMCYQIKARLDDEVSFDYLRGGRVRGTFQIEFFISLDFSERLSEWKKKKCHLNLSNLQFF